MLQGLCLPWVGRIRGGGRTGLPDAADGAVCLQAKRWVRRCCTTAAATSARTTCTVRSWAASSGMGSSPSSTSPSPGTRLRRYHPAPLPVCLSCPPSVEKDPKGWRFPLAVIGAPSTTAVLCSHVHGLCFPTGCGALLPSPHSCVVSYQIYVQHLLKKNKKNIWKLVHEGNAHIYVCG